MNRLNDKLTDVFGFDLRSLAAFRIGVAIVILLDLWYRSREITAYYSDEGILPRTARIELAQLNPGFGFEYQWSLHMLSGESPVQALMMLIAAFFAIWLLLGYRTRLAAITSWILLMSLDGRNPDLLNSGDVLLRSMLFWALFVPLGARYSLDSRTHAEQDRDERNFLSAGTIALLAQLCAMYLFSVVMKVKPVDDIESSWTGDYSAVYYALNCDAFARHPALWLRQFPTVMQGLTISSLLLELFGPLLLFVPWKTKSIRAVVAVSFIAFHICLGSVLTIGLFPIICIVCWFLFVPGKAWDRLVKLTTTMTQKTIFTNEAFRGIANRIAEQFSGRDVPRLRRHWMTESIVVLLMLYMLVWNVRELDFRYWEPRILPRSWNVPARVLGLDQNWSMFAPLPRTEDGWLVMEGTLHDGSVVNLWEPDKPVPWDKPELVSATFKTQRWRKYLDNLTTEPYGPYRMYFCNWLAKRWNDEHAGEDDSRRVEKVELSHRIELTPPPGRPIPEPETRVLWTWYYE